MKRLDVDAIEVVDLEGMGWSHFEVLRQRLRRAGAGFAIVDEALGPDDATLLNLVFYAPDATAEILFEPLLGADQLMHSGWHQVARERAGEAADSSLGLLWGESIASAYDVFLIGELSRRDPDASLLQTQLPRMAERFADAGFAEEDFAALLQRLALDPQAGFLALQRLLFELSRGLLEAADAAVAERALLAHGDDPMWGLVHHYEIPSWLLYAARHGHARHAGVDDLQRALQAAADPFAWLLDC